MIELKPQLTPLTYPDGLKTFVSEQTARRIRVKTAIDNATIAVEKARADAVVPVIGDTKRVGNANVTLRTGEDALLQNSLRSHAKRQTIKAISDIRASLDAVAVPIIKQMNVASDTAREMATRHFDKYSILRRAKGTVNGLMEATQLRAFYAAILENIEPRELAAFAQQAIDQGDPILADAVQRRNFSIPRTDRPFMNQSFLALVPNSEFDSAQVMLATVTQLYEEAGLMFAKFGSEYGHVSLQRMIFGIKNGMTRIADDGSLINPKNIPAHFADAGE